MLIRKYLKAYWGIVDTVPVCHLKHATKKVQLKQCYLVKWNVYAF